MKIVAEIELSGPDPETAHEIVADVLALLRIVAENEGYAVHIEASEVPDDTH